MRSIFGVLGAATLACACSAEPPTASIGDAVCFTTLNFPDDATRLDFLERNIGSITRNAADETVSFTSHPSEPRLYIIAFTDICSTTDLDAAYSLRGADAYVTHTEPSIFMTVAEEVGADIVGVQQGWNQDDVRACVGRITPAARDEDWRIMRVIVNAGMRDAQVHGDNHGISFSTKDSCALLQQITSAALALAPSPNRDVRYCENSSHAACGDPATFSYEPPP